jgi:hypothetical protein
VFAAPKPDVTLFGVVDSASAGDGVAAIPTQANGQTLVNLGADNGQTSYLLTASLPSGTAMVPYTGVTLSPISGSMTFCI